MGSIRFPFPDSIERAIYMLNGSELDIWNLSLNKEDAMLCVYDGDQVMFRDGSEEAVRNFLSGIFLATFNGKGLDQINRGIENRDKILDE